jgi:hypothetical protein
LKIYMASNFSDKDRVKQRCGELQALGITTLSRWASETAPHNCTITDKPAQYMRETAVYDIEDICAADVLIIVSPTDAEMVNMTPHQLSRGGRHFEEGFIYGLMWAQRWTGAGTPQRLILLGRRENVFHFLDGESVAKNYPVVQQFDTWPEVKNYLVSIS